MIIERIFQVLAVVLAGAAAYFLWTGNKDGGFVSAVLACVAFFLSVRFQVKERNRLREAERSAGGPDRVDHMDQGGPPAK